MAAGVAVAASDVRMSIRSFKFCSAHANSLSLDPSSSGIMPGPNLLLPADGMLDGMALEGRSMIASFLSDAGGFERGDGRHADRFPVERPASAGSLSEEAMEEARYVSTVLRAAQGSRHLQDTSLLFPIVGTFWGTLSAPSRNLRQILGHSLGDSNVTFWCLEG